MRIEEWQVHELKTIKDELDELKTIANVDDVLFMLKQVIKILLKEN